MNLLKISIAVLSASMLFTAKNLPAQDRLVPLSRNVHQQDYADKNFTKNHPNSSLTRNTDELGDGDQIIFMVDTVHLPFIDDFSSNKVKSYKFDLSDTNITTQVCPDFLVSDTIVNFIEFMNDTSYEYTYNADSNEWDSTALTPFDISFVDTADCQSITQVDTVWPVPEGRVINGVFIGDISPDSMLFSSNDTLYIIPPEDREILWTSNDAFINQTMADAPPTIGVATLDGLDSIGFPRNDANPNVYGEADVFTSAPVFLRTKPGGGNYNNSDSIYFSFFYQPQGLGNRPEPEDSLILEFYNITTGFWERQWSSQGKGNQPFEEVFIPINDTVYFQDGFRFRFRNYATLSGNFDHWHLDYIRIGSYPNSDPEEKDDVAYAEQAHSLLKEYSRMPWAHFETDPEAFMGSESNVLSSNLSQVQTNTNYVLEIFDQDDSLLHTSQPVLSPNFPPQSQETQTLPVENFVFHETDNREKKSFQVVNRITLPLQDDIPENNFARFNQEFPLHYAYDDRSAEHAYEVVQPGAKIAAEYDFVLPDTLRAVNIYFPPTLEDYSQNLFQIKVWSSLEPEEEIHSSIFYNPKYTARNLVSRYDIDPPLPVEGTVFVGIQQQNQPVFIGMDVNFNRREKFYFHAGNGWFNMSFEGSLMINPEFDTEYDPYPVKVEDVVGSDSEMKIYPNPAHDRLNVQHSGNEPFSTEIYDLSGRLKISIPETHSPVNISALESGTYIIKTTYQKEIFTKKFIKK